MKPDIIDYLYKQFPFYERQGKKAYRPGMSNSEQFDMLFNYPHTSYKTIHVAGTNGKGSTCHMLASILQQQGYKTGLYTSPHVVHFNERIRVNGNPISNEYIEQFVNRYKTELEAYQPSFFEVVTALALLYFKDQKVDVAVIETGLGGRLDCTNVIKPIVSVITNISFDHKDILGDTIQAIATEKAGIIKHKTPVIIGETNSETSEIFRRISNEKDAAIRFADAEISLSHIEQKNVNSFNVQSDYFTENIEVGLLGIYQSKNIKTVLSTIDTIKTSLPVSIENIQLGFKNVLPNTGLLGRWQKVSSKPDIICDIGHNEAGIQEVMQQIGKCGYNSVHIVFGMVNDKDIEKVVNLLPSTYRYYITNASIERALHVDALSEIFHKKQLQYTKYKNVEEAIKKAQKNADVNDLIFIGGSNFVVADALKSDIFFPQAIA